jgi:hypothetical protein
MRLDQAPEPRPTAARAEIARTDWKNASDPSRRAAAEAIPGHRRPRSGRVASFARPGGNLTGFTNFGPELTPKRLELLSELVPQPGVIDLLVNPNSPTADGQIGDIQEAARVNRCSSLS